MSAQSATAGASSEDTSTTATSDVSSNVRGVGAEAPEVPRPRDLARAEQQLAAQGVAPPTMLQGPSRPLQVIAEAESVSSGAAAEHQIEGAAAQVIQTAGQTGAANGEGQAVTPVHDSQAGQGSTETAEVMFASPVSQRTLASLFASPLPSPPSAPSPGHVPRGLRWLQSMGSFFQSRDEDTRSASLVAAPQVTAQDGAAPSVTRDQQATPLFSPAAQAQLRRHQQDAPHLYGEGGAPQISWEVGGPPSSHSSLPMDAIQAEVARQLEGLLGRVQQAERENDVLRERLASLATPRNAVLERGENENPDLSQRPPRVNLTPAYLASLPPQLAIRTLEEEVAKEVRYWAPEHVGVVVDVLLQVPPQELLELLHHPDSLREQVAAVQGALGLSPTAAVLQTQIPTPQPVRTPIRTLTAPSAPTHARELQHQESSTQPSWRTSAAQAFSSFVSGLPSRVGVGSGSIGFGSEVGGSRFGVDGQRNLAELGLDEGGTITRASPIIIQDQTRLQTQQDDTQPSGVGPNPEMPETRLYHHPAQAQTNPQHATGSWQSATPVNPVARVEGASSTQGWNLAGLLGQSLTGSVSRGLGSVGLPFTSRGQVESSASKRVASGGEGQGSSGSGLLGMRQEDRNPGAKVTFPEINQPPSPVFSLSDPSLRTIPPRASTTQATPSLLEALAQGVCQLQDLQRAAMESKSPTGSEAETVKFSKSELPSLPDVSADDSSIKFSDWLPLVRSLVEDASLTSAAWWQHILTEANTAYETWQACDPLRRLSIEPQAKESQNPKWIRLNARMSSMMYAVMSPALRADATSRRVTSSTLHLVFRLLLHYQPGGASERATILAKLQTPGAAKNAEEALSSLRRWSDWWNRLTETGMTEPDPSVIVRALLSIVERPLQSAPEVLFRTQVARSALCIDQRPTLQQALSFHRHLLAEFEQLCLSVGGSQDGPKVRLAQASQEAIPKAKANCKYYLSSTGCKKGLSCQYKHNMQDLPKDVRARKCLRCGAETHRAKQCPHPGKGDKHSSDKDAAGANRGGPASPTSTSPETSTAKSAAARKAQKQQELQQQQAQASQAASSGLQEQANLGVTSVAADSGVQGLGQQLSTSSGGTPAQVGNHANPGIYVIQTPASAPAAVPQQVVGTTPAQAHVAAMQSSTSTVDPIAITRLLQQIGLNPGDGSSGRIGQDQGPRLNALVVSNRAPLQEETPTGGTRELGPSINQCSSREASSQKPDVLADSGATNVLRGPRSNEEWDTAEPVQVKLATNAETILRQTPVGSLLHPISHEEPEPPPIVPLGRIIERLGYVLSWDKDACILRAPNGTTHRLKVREGCPYLSHTDAGRLILRLEAKAAEEGLKQLQDATMCTATAVYRARESMSRTWYDAMKDYSVSGSPEDAGRAEFLARWLDYAPPCSKIGAFPQQNQVNAWEMLSRIPGWSRRYRRRLKASKNWIVHLFAGEGTWDPLPITPQRDEVVVTVDVRAGKAQDIRKGPIWDVLVWAARTGRIAHVIGAPPRVSFLPNPSRGIPQNEAYFTDLGLHNPTLRSAGEPNQRSIRELSLVGRMLILHALATAGREVYRHNRHLASEVGFVMEHPQYSQAPTVSGGSLLHSVWESVLWKRYAEDAMMDVITFTSRGEVGSHEQDKTEGGTIRSACEHRNTWTLGTNIPGLILHAHQFPPDEGMRRHHAAKWTPSFKRGLSRAIGSFNGALRLAPMSAAEWSQHQKAGHVPFRKDCATCVSGAAASRAHRKLSHPHVHTLNVDLMGPFKTKGWDATCRKKTEGTLKYALVGCYRFPDPLDPGPPWPEEAIKGEEDQVQEEPRDDKIPDPFECEETDEGLEEYAPSEKEDEGKEGDEMLEEIFESEGKDDTTNHKAPVQSPEWDLKWDGATKLLHFAVPLSSSKASGAVVAIQQIIAYLGGLNLPVFRLHSDRGREFENASLKNFLARHAIVQSFGEPGFPQTNGTVENTVRSLKAASRKLLIDSHLPLNAWPQALATAATLQRSSVLGLPNKLLTPFGTKVLALQPRSHEKRQEFSSRWIEYRYVGLSQLVSGAHVLVKHEGGKAMFMHSTNVRADADAPPEPPPMHVPLVGRRLTGKTKPPSPTDGPAARQVNKAEALIASFEEEAQKVLSDWDPVKARQCVLKWCRKMPGSKFLAGLYRHGAGIVGEHNGNRQRPFFVRLLNALLMQYAPDHEYTSIGLFTDAQPVHTDKNNHPESMNVVLPLLMPRSGGHHWTQVMPGDVVTGSIEEMHSDSGWKYYGVVNRLQTLVPSLLNPRRRHGVTDYQGNRVVLVGYRIQTLEKVKVDTWANMESLGFPCEGLSEGLSTAELRQLTERSRGRSLDDVTSPFSCAANPASSTLGDQTLEDSGLLERGGGNRRFQDVNVGAHPRQTDGGRGVEQACAGKSRDMDASDSVLEDSGLQRSGGWTEKVQGVSESVELHVNWGLKVSPLREGDAFQGSLRAPLPVVPKEMNKVQNCLKHHDSAGQMSHSSTGTSQDFVPRNVRSLLVPLSGEGYVELADEESCEATAETQSLPKSLRTIQAVRKVEQSYTSDLETLLESLSSPLKVVHLCDPKEAKHHLMKWKTAIQKEFDGIKHGLKRLRRNSSEFRRLLDLPNTIQVPSKIVYSVKPPAQGAVTSGTSVSKDDPDWVETMFFRRKARIVCCGNYADETGLPVYASGASSETLRILLIITSRKR